MLTTAFLRASALIAAAAVFAAGCSGSSNSSSSTSTANSSAPTTATAAATAGTSMSGSMAMASAAPVPPDLKCPDAIVWVNTSSKAYHMAGDKFYGRTKHGQYMCQSTAEGKGYHMAGMPKHHTGSQMTGGSAQPSPAST